MVVRRMGRIRASICALALIAGQSTVAWSEAPAAPAAAPAPAPSAPGWDAFVDGIRDLPARMLALLPEDMQHDPQIQAEIGRLALAGLTTSTLGALGDDPEHPMFLPSPTVVLSSGQPNADSTYRTTVIDSAGTYRLRGRMGSLRMARIAESGYSLTQSKPGAVNLGTAWSVHDIQALHVDAAGRFDVILSMTKPAGYDGDWWQMAPGTTRLLLRFVKSDWAKETDPTISIERLDKPVSRPRPSAAVLEQKLRGIPAYASFLSAMFVPRVDQLRREGYLNRLKGVDFSKQGGLRGQFYYEGAYELTDDEALLLEVKPPAQCLYSSIILTNAIYETTDWVNNHSSLSDSQYRLDKDGMLRVVVSRRDPGVPNWLDTAGYGYGAIQGRWTECDSQPIPTVRKLKVAEVRAKLPADTPLVTPAQREHETRERRNQLVERPLW